MKLKVKFGTPHHGWLPVEITQNDFELQFEASDVPVNPIDQLIEGLLRVINNLESEVWWHLEPPSYYFNFSRISTDQFCLAISFADDSKVTTTRQELFRAIGTKKEIIAPFWRAIKEFLSHSYVEPDWPPLYTEELEELTKKIKAES